MDEEKVEEQGKEVLKKSKIDRETVWVLSVMAGLVILFLSSYYFFQSLKTFEYEGMSFTEEKFGDIPLYHYYYLTSFGAITGSAAGEPRKVDVYLRNDPRENRVPVDGEIEFFRGKYIYLGINGTELTQCSFSSVALATLSGFVGQNGFTLKAGTANIEEANNETMLEHVSCELRPENPVIIIQSGESTKITKKENCYTIDVANCEVQEAVEKFVVQSIVDAKNRAAS